MLDWVRAGAARSLPGKLRNPEIWDDLKGTLPSVSAGGGADSCSGVLWESVSRILAKELVSLGQQMGWKISNKCLQLRGVPEVKGPFPNIVQTLFLLSPSESSACTPRYQSSFLTVSELQGLHKVFGFLAEHFFLFYRLRNYHKINANISNSFLALLSKMA